MKQTLLGLLAISFLMGSCNMGDHKKEVPPSSVDQDNRDTTRPANGDE